VHRDLKPSNVFLAARPGARLSVKLLDFGVAKLIGAPDITKAGAVVGTPAYMAPEQARGADNVDARADIYGLGAVLYKMVAGRAPFEGADATASLSRLMSGPPRPIAGMVPDLPVALIQIIEDTMAREAGERPTDAAGVARRLAEVGEALAGEGSESTTLRPSDVTAASADATAVMPRGAVVEAVTARSARRRQRPRAIVDVLVRSTVAGATAATVLDALGASHTTVLAGAGAAWALLAALSARRVRDAWDAPRELGARRARTRRGLRRGLLVLGGLTLALFTAQALRGDDFEAGWMVAALVVASGLSGLLALRPRHSAAPKKPPRQTTRAARATQASRRMRANPSSR
jgi:serine/threonine-protein kinase